MKIIIHHHGTNAQEQMDGDEHQLRHWLREKYPELRVTDNEPLADVIEDLNSRQHLEAVLENDAGTGDPLADSDLGSDRILALKSKHVNPVSLRAALQDEDPEVREAVARHPALTPELMQDILSGVDGHLKAIVLSRPDLRPEELQHCLRDPEVQELVARHPALTPDQSRELMQPHLSPETRAAISQGLIKSVGYLTFPHFGEGQVYTQPHLTDGVGASKRSKLMGIPDATPSTGKTIFNAGSKPVPETERRLASVVDTSRRQKELGADIAHEAQHTVFARLKQKYGVPATDRIISHLLRGLNPAEQKVASAVSDDKKHIPEETLTHFINYLTSPPYRDRVHADIGIGPDDARFLQDQMKSMWKRLRNRAETLTPEHLGLSLRKDEEKIQDWVQDQTESKPEEQLGYAVHLTAYIDAAKFLTGKTVDPTTLRAAIFSSDGDVREAVLRAYQLDDRNSRAAFAAVEGLKSLKKNEVDVLENPKQITTLYGDPEAGAGISNAFSEGRVKPLKLGGKHSSGVRMVEDDQNQVWLLKPGSGDQSPAAGARDLSTSQSRREAAFSAVAHNWGIEEVPEALLLGVDGHEVAALKMLPSNWVSLFRATEKDAGLVRRVLEPYRKAGTLYHWSVLDLVLGNPDRHGQNILVGPAAEGNPVALIDHGSAFAGPGFSPGSDDNSFVPFYLRAWAPPGFHGRAPAEQHPQMPVLDHEADAGLKAWVRDLDPEQLKSTLLKLGIDPTAMTKRLEAVKAGLGEANFSSFLNRLWLRV